MPIQMNNTSPSTGTIFFGGLNNLRGLKFGSDGALYVAESGCGGTTIMTNAQDCEQVPAPIGPYTAGLQSARISKISSDGAQRTTIVENLPSSQNSIKAGGLVSGVADIAFVNGSLYALIKGAGCSH